MRARLGIRWIVGVIARAMVGDAVFDLAKVLAGSVSDPLGFGARRRDAGELADRRECEGIVGECGGEQWQAAEARATRRRSWAVRGA